MNLVTAYQLLLLVWYYLDERLRNIAYQLPAHMSYIVFLLGFSDAGWPWVNEKSLNQNGLVIDTYEAFFT
jgi:hypothetical protein